MTQENNPWKTVSSKQIYTNPWITLREDQVIRPDGKKGIYSVVDTRTAIGIIALTPLDEIYLVGQWRYPLELYSWEIIEGGSDEGESSLDTAKRELLEEAGLVANRWEELGTDIHLSNCFSSEVAKFFIATDLIQKESSPDETEVLQVRKIKFEEALSMVDRGEITDAMSVVAIMRLARKFRL